MRGKRCRELRRKFIQKHGRAPMGAQRSMRKTAVQNEKTGEWRNVFRWAGRVFSFQDMTVTKISEWRQVKRAWKGRAAA